MVPILSKMNPMPKLWHYFKIHSNIIPPWKPKSFNWPLPFRSCIHFSSLPCWQHIQPTSTSLIWSLTILEKTLTVIQLVKKYFIFYGTWMLITTYTRTCMHTHTELTRWAKSLKHNTSGSVLFTHRFESWSGHRRVPLCVHTHIHTLIVANCYSHHHQGFITVILPTQSQIILTNLFQISNEFTILYYFLPVSLVPACTTRGLLFCTGRG